MRIVVDITNIVSGSLWSGPSARVLAAVDGTLVELFLSDVLIATLTRVLGEEKFDVRLKLRGQSVAEILAGIVGLSTVIQPADIQAPPELRDLDDLAVLACAVAAEADLIVSGDRDLLSLRSFQGIPIVTATDAARTFGLV